VKEKDINLSFCGEGLRGVIKGYSNNLNFPVDIPTVGNPVKVFLLSFSKPFSS